MPRVFAVMKSYVEALRLRKAIPWDKKGFLLSIELTPISAIDKIYNIRPDILILQNGILHVNCGNFVSAAVKANPEVTIILINYAQENLAVSEEEREHLVFLDRSDDPLQLENALERRYSHRNSPVSDKAAASAKEDSLFHCFGGSAKVQTVFLLGQYPRHIPSLPALQEASQSWKYRCEDDGILLATDEPIYCCSRLGEVPQALTDYIASLGKKPGMQMKTRCILVGQPVPPEYLDEEYAVLKGNKRYGYFCDSCEMLTRNTIRERHSELDYGAVGRIVNGLMVAVVTGDPVVVQQSVEELYLGILVHSYSFSGIEFIRRKLNEYYRLLNDVLYGISGAVLFETGQVFREIEKEADYVAAGFSELIATSRTKKIHRKVSAAISIVLEHYDSVESMDDVAERLGITKTYLSKVFKEDLDVNFVMFLRRIRVSKAKELMLLGTHSIMEISRLVGYEDPKYFTRVFKRVTGETPTQYIAGTSNNTTSIGEAP